MSAESIRTQIYFLALRDCKRTGNSCIDCECVDCTLERVKLATEQNTEERPGLRRRVSSRTFVWFLAIAGYLTIFLGLVFELCDRGKL